MESPHQPYSSPMRITITLTVLAILFQYGHFVEHIIQASAWLSGYTQTPYMTEFGHRLSGWLGTAFFDGASVERIQRLGMELLHLIGNTVFFLGTLGLWFLFRTRITIIALAVQSFHMFEHISLTLSSVFIDKAIGLSTLYGMPMSNFTSVTYRVWWHFSFNAIPTLLVTCALIAAFNNRRRTNLPVIRMFSPSLAEQKAN